MLGIMLEPMPKKQAINKETTAAKNNAKNKGEYRHTNYRMESNRPVVNPDYDSMNSPSAVRDGLAYRQPL